MYYEESPFVMDLNYERFDPYKTHIRGVPFLEFTDVYCRLLYDYPNGSKKGHWLFVAADRVDKNVVVVEGIERKSDIRQQYEKHIDNMLRLVGWTESDEETKYGYTEVSMSNRNDLKKNNPPPKDGWMISHVFIQLKQSEPLCGPVSLAALEYCQGDNDDWSSFRRSMNLEMLKENIIKSFEKKVENVQSDFIHYITLPPFRLHSTN